VSTLKSQVEPARLMPAAAKNGIMPAIAVYAKGPGTVDYSGTPHRFVGGKVDSRFEAKKSASAYVEENDFKKGEGGHGYADGSDMISVASSKNSNKFDNRPVNIPAAVGSSFYHHPNAHRVVPVPPPLAPSVPRPFVAGHSSDLFDGPMLHNRTACGTIIGKTEPKYMDSMHVPQLVHETPLGPDNPVRDLNEYWQACWDSEAGAVYYYNHETGEATWIHPVL
jgi:hypothetical protein